MANMLRYETVGSGARPPWWRSSLYAVLAILGILLSLTFSPVGHNIADDGADTYYALFAVGLLIGIVGVFALFWRDRFPFSLTIFAAVVPLLLPVGNTLVLIALASLIGRRRGPAVWLTAGLVAVTSSLVVTLDALAQPRGASLMKMFLAPEGADPTAPASVSTAPIVLIAITGFAVSVGLGLAVRANRLTTLAKRDFTAERQHSTRLGDEAARRQERERIAREVHDAMGHRLSLLNLHAGALEAHASDDPRMEQSAKLVQQSARAAMDDLRSLLAVLREPIGSEGPPLPLPQLAQVVAESFGAGQQLSSNIFISDADRAHPTLSRAVYRIVQELLSNSRKHAPGEPVFLLVEGGPSTGVIIDVRNRYTGGWGNHAPGSARGLAGVTERAELLGGKVAYGLDEGGLTFRVRVELPWRDVDDG